jgi:hypothetical protein
MPTIAKKSDSKPKAAPVKKKKKKTKANVPKPNTALPGRSPGANKKSSLAVEN